MLITSPRLARRLDEANHSDAELLDFKLHASTPSHMPSAVAGEAIVSGIFELPHDAILHNRTTSCQTSQTKC